MYACFMTTDLTDIWLKDSICETIEEMGAYIDTNRDKLDQAAGPNGDWSVHHYEPGSRKSLTELSLTKDEASELDTLIN